MLNIPSSVKNLFKQDGVHKNFRVHFPNGELADLTNDNVVQESVKFSESICSQDVFKFGLTEASVIEFETVGVANMYGMTIECSCEIDCSSLSAADKATIAAGTWDGTWDGVNAVFSVPYGTFRVESCPRDHQSMAHRQVTAYTQAMQDMSLSQFPDLSYIARWFPDVSIDSFAILSKELKTGVTVTLEGGPTIDTINPVEFEAGVLLYDSNGNKYTVSEVYVDGGVVTGAYCYFAVYINHPSTDPAWGIPHSFAEYVGTESQLSYMQAHGEKIADALTNAGYELCFDSTGRRIYDSNVKALEKNYPMLFGPVVCYELATKRGEQIFPMSPMRFDDLTPLIYHKISGYDSAFVKNKGVLSISGISLYAPLTPDQYDDHYIKLVKTENNQQTTIKIPFNDLSSYTHYFKCYGLQSYSNKMTVSAVSDKKANYRALYNGSVVVYKGTEFYYGDTFNVLDLFNAALEIKAAFGRYLRNGNVVQTTLDNTSPVPIIPGEYSQMWFDEYYVEPIGAVRYSYTDEAGEEQIVDYVFGSGASVYDMTDNAVLKLMDGADPSTIEAMLDASFIPHLSPVNFVPIDLAMKGLPYIEAGDALSVTAQDATVCNSFALRHEIRGIQALEAQIDSESGLIIDSGEGS